MINCSYFSTNNLVFSSNNDIIQFQKPISCFLKLNTACKRNNYQEPRTKRLGDWGIGIVFSLFSYLIYSRINEKVHTNDETICLIPILVIHSLIIGCSLMSHRFFFVLIFNPCPQPCPPLPSSSSPSPPLFKLDMS